MKKRLAILSFYLGKHRRGVESWVNGLEKNLKKDFEIKIFSYKDANLGIDWSNLENKNTILRKLYLDYWSFNILKFNLLIITKLIKFSPNIILATDGGWESRVMRIFTWLMGSKLVIAGQAGIGFDEYNNIYSFPDTFIALTSKAKNWAKKYNPFMKVVRIPNAVDTTVFRPVRKKKYRNILSVGALEKGKRMDSIIEAVSNIKNCKLAIIGSGKEKSYLKKLAKDLEVNLQIKSVPHEEIYKEYQKADLFISASKSYYAFEIVIIEAMACNLPIVANDDDIRREIVGKAGILSNPEIIERFVEDIKRALSAEWRDIPRKQSQKFNWETVSEKYKKLFNSL